MESALTRMSKKFKSILSCILCIIMFLSNVSIHVSAAPQVNSIPQVAFSQKSSSTITIDGNLNDWSLDKTATNLTEGVSSDNSLKFNTAWDENFFYIGVEVDDDTVVSKQSQQGYYWQDDTIEVFIDADNKKTGTYDTNDHQIFIRAIDNLVYTTQANVATEFSNNVVSAVQMKKDAEEKINGYTMEVSIPWSSLGISPKNGLEMGFDISNDDCDSEEEGSDRESTITWSNTEGNNYISTANFGNIVLYDDDTPIIATEYSPVIDGIMENEWHLDKQFSVNDNVVHFGALCDEENIYVYAEVLDTNMIQETTAPESAVKDSLLLYFDGDNCKSESYNAKDIAIVIPYTGADYTLTKDGITRAVKQSSEGYTVEVKLPFNVLGIKPLNRSVIGFDIANYDFDEMDANTYGAWSGDISNETATSNFGNLIFDNPDLVSKTVTDPVLTFQANLSDLVSNAFDYNGVSTESSSIFGGVNLLKIAEKNAFVTYKSPSGDIVKFNIETPVRADVNDQYAFKFFVSTDNNTYRQVIPCRTVIESYSAENEDYALIKYTYDGMKPGEKYLKIINDEEPLDARMISSVSFDYKEEFDGVKLTFNDPLDDSSKLFKSSGMWNGIFGGWDNSFGNGLNCASDNNDRYVIYKSQGNDILNLQVDTVETNFSPEDGITFYVSPDNITYSKVNSTKNQMDLINGWQYVNRYEIPYFESGIRYIKIVLSPTVEKPDAIFLNNVSFDYATDLLEKELNDPCDDTKLTIENAGVWVGKGPLDIQGIKPAGDTTVRYMVYKTPEQDIHSFKMNTIEGTSTPATIFNFYVSEDGQNYTSINANRALLETVQGWVYKYEYTIDQFPQGTKYIKIEVNEELSNAWSITIDNVSLKYLYDNKEPVLTSDITAGYTDINMPINGNAYAIDDNGDVLTYSISKNASNGIAQIDPSSGKWIYTPNIDYVGNDSFEIAVSDGNVSTLLEIKIMVNYKATNLNYYVSSIFGNDSNDGSETKPFKTIQKAHDVSKPGDTINIMNGEYTEVSGEGAVVITRSGSPDAYITYQPYKNDSPVIRCNIAWNNILILGASYINISGIKIEGNEDSINRAEAEALYDQFASGDIDWAANVSGYINQNGIGVRTDSQTGNIPHHINITNCDVSKCPSGGIAVSDTDYLTIKGNTVHDNCKYNIMASSGISVYTSVDFDNNQEDYRTIVTENISYNNQNTIKWYITKSMSDGNGIIIDDNKNTQKEGRKPYTGRTLVANNLTYNNGGSGIHAFSSSNVDIFNNTAYDNNQTETLNNGQIYGLMSTNCRIMNNIMYCKTGNKANESYGNQNVEYDYNIYYNATSIEVQGEHDLVADPKFKNIANCDFRLLSDSPAIDAGDSSIAPFNDLDAKLRPVGNGVDIGAYEYASPVVIIIPDSKVDISNSVSVSIDGNYSYTGKAIKPAVSVVYNNLLLVEGTDYVVSYDSNIDSGIGKVIITGIGKYEGSKKQTFEISRKSVDSSTIKTSSIKSVTYTGKKLTPVVTIKDNESGNILIEDKDYKITYYNNINASSRNSKEAPYVEIAGINNYMGDVKITFTINRAKISTFTKTSTIKTQIYKGKAITPYIKIVNKYTGEILKMGVDYKLAYYNNGISKSKTGSKRPYVKIIGLGNYTGIKIVYFYIKK